MQKMKELLLFQVGTLQLGMDLSTVRSIQSAPGIASNQVEKHNRFTPLTEDQDVPLYNLSAVLGDENSSANPENEKLIVVNAQDQPVGLIVERVDRVVKVDNDRIEPLSPIFKGPALSCFPRVLRHEDKLVLLLAPRGMMDIAQQMQKSQANTIFSAKEPGPVIQQSTSAEVVYTECDETGAKPKPHMNSGRPE